MPFLKVPSCPTPQKNYAPRPSLTPFTASVAVWESFIDGLLLYGYVALVEREFCGLRDLSRLPLTVAPSSNENHLWNA